MAYPPYYVYLPPPPVFESSSGPAQPLCGGYPVVTPSPTFYGYSSPTSFQLAWTQDPPGTFRTMVEWDTNSEKVWPKCTYFIDPYTKNADFLNILMSILKGRLGYEFPQNFKAILYLDKAKEEKKKKDEADAKKKLEEMWKKSVGGSYGSGWPGWPYPPPASTGGGLAWQPYGPSYMPYSFYPKP
ncbi:hypothetical protein IAR50_005197 [Cryptococcus sp. DSM 104548]